MTCFHRPGISRWDFQRQRRSIATQQRQTCVHSEQLSAGTQGTPPRMPQPSVTVHLQQQQIIPEEISIV